MSENHDSQTASAGPTALDAGGDIEKLLGEILPAIAGQVAAKHNYEVTPAVLEAINAALSQAWDEFTDSGERVYIIADACRVIGVTFGVHQDSGYFQFQTVFSPSLRYDHESSPENSQKNYTDIALGFFKNYDLYYARRGEADQKLLARHGDEPGEFITHDLLAHGAPADEAHEALREAFDRAQRANLFAGSPLAGDDELGSLMIPELTVLEYKQTGSLHIDL
ncbi:MAG: hypothetical protein LBV80_11710 [Deltaproteobacteria bacterium]|jgi:hypothetical protein|nr:hypothetical protein [Deltaproteobacteria bacterium]